MSDVLIIRHATEGDLPFIKSRFFQEYRAEAKRHLRTDQALLPATVQTIYFEIDDIIKRSFVFIAADPSDPAFIHGFTVFQVINGVLIVHFAFTRKAFRKLGVQKKIIAEITERDESLPIALTFVNQRTSALIKAKSQKYELKPNLRGLE